MKNTEFRTVMNTVITTISIAKIDEMTAKVNDLLTDKQREAYSNAANERREILTNGVQTSLFDNERENNTMGKTETKEEIKNEVATVTNGDAEVIADEKKIDKAMKHIAAKTDQAGKCYVEIAGDVAYLYDTKAFKTLGYKNIYDLCSDKFTMGRGTVQNLREIYAKYGDGNYHIKAEYKDMKVRAMLAEIKAEKDARAALEDSNKVITNGEDGDSDGDTENTSKDSKAKVDIIDFDFTNADKWSVDDLLDKIREEIEAGGVTDIDANSNIIFKITH